MQKKENLNDIFQRYANKINKDINDIYFINNGNKINNNNIKLEEIKTDIYWINSLLSNRQDKII